jgi:anti-anti-sigma factor
MKMTIQPLDADMKIISLDGRLDIEGARAIDDQFAFATTTSAAKIVVDLASVVFIASIGIRTLFNAARAQGARGGRVVLAQPTEMVRRVLETAGVGQLMPIFDTVDAARKSLEAS